MDTKNKITSLEAFLISIEIVLAQIFLGYVFLDIMFTK
jgi:hypothetical protein